MLIVLLYTIGKVVNQIDPAFLLHLNIRRCSIHLLFQRVGRILSALYTKHSKQDDRDNASRSNGNRFPVDR
jgi:hypothetical protein